jgi:hypothetical protein
MRGRDRGECPGGERADRRHGARGPRRWARPSDTSRTRPSIRRWRRWKSSRRRMSSSARTRSSRVRRGRRLASASWRSHVESMRLTRATDAKARARRGVRLGRNPCFI